MLSVPPLFRVFRGIGNEKGPGDTEEQPEPIGAKKNPETMVATRGLSITDPWPTPNVSGARARIAANVVIA
jgi:hypothetical protein